MACKKKARQGGEVDKKDKPKMRQGGSVGGKMKRKKTSTKKWLKIREGADRLPHFNNITTTYYEQQVY